MARRRMQGVDNAGTADDSSSDRPTAVTVNTNEVARRAYDLYLSRGQEDGHDVEDWLQAERELRNMVIASL